MGYTDIDLPAVKADFCSPVLNYGEISKIYFANKDNPLINWTSLAEWSSRLDNSIIDSTKIRYLHGIGSKLKPESTRANPSINKLVDVTKTHTIIFNVDEVHDDNYALLKHFEDSNGQEVLCWYEIGNYLYGGNSGIRTIIFMNEVTTENKEELQKFESELIFFGEHPDRILSPLV